MDWCLPLAATARFGREKTKVNAVQDSGGVAGKDPTQMLSRSIDNVPYRLSSHSQVEKGLGDNKGSEFEVVRLHDLLFSVDVHCLQYHLQGKGASFCLIVLQMGSSFSR